MGSDKAPSGGVEKALVGRLDRLRSEAQRRTDRYIRLFHRAKEEAVKARLFALAVRNDEIAADATRQLREAWDGSGAKCR